MRSTIICTDSHGASGGIMAKSDKPFDVFISYSTPDAAFALEVANGCRAAGLEAFAFADPLTAPIDGDVLWEALAESRAWLAILSPSGLTPSMAIEFGAARAWNKPIYAIATDLSSTRLPSALSGIRLDSIGRLPDIIRDIKANVRQLSDEDRDFLAQLYAEKGIGADQFALDPKQLDDLVDRFHRGRGKKVAGERLLSELLRLRKQGKLPRLRPARPLRSKSESA
jgi:hypothetical protein